MRPVPQDGHLHVPRPQPHRLCQIPRGARRLGKLMRQLEALGWLRGPIPSSKGLPGETPHTHTHSAEEANAPTGSPTSRGSRPGSEPGEAARAGGQDNVH